MQILIVVLTVLLVLTSCVPAVPDETSEAAHSTTGPMEVVTEPARQNVLEFRNYSLIQENERFFIRSKIVSPSETESDEIMYIMLNAEYPEFPTIAEMKRAVETGNLTESEVYALTRNSQKKPAVSEICNLNRLFEAEYPDDLTLERIDLTGSSYRFVFQENYGYLWCMEQSSYDRYYQNYADPVGTKTLLSEETTEDRNAMITCTKDTVKGEIVRTVRYELPISGGKIYVMESYKKDADRENAVEKLERLEIFGNAHGQYFYMFLMDLAERPGIEWLTAIGLREFIEADVQ